MASDSSLGDEGWPKWKLALVIGAPVALGAAGVWLYKRRLSSLAAVTSKTSESVVIDTTKVPQACLFSHWRMRCLHFQKRSVYTHG